MLLLPILLGWVGLVIDSGLLLAGQRQAQNAADAAALAAAMDKFRGASDAMAAATANTFVQQYNGLSTSPTLVLNGGSVNAINIGPTQGPHAGDAHYVEVILTLPVRTLFVQVLGINANQTVVARAVGGYEPVGSGEGAIVLDPRPLTPSQPGISVQGGATLQVNGTVVVNSPGAGYDQYGAWVDNWGAPQYAVTTSNGSIVKAQYLQVHGGVDTPANYQNIDPAGGNPLFCRAGIAPDPLSDLAIPVPYTTTVAKSAVNVGNGQTVTVPPGIYSDINVSQGATVTFQPGIYILSPDGPNKGLRLNGKCTVTGNGVLFYVTGDDYVQSGPDNGKYDIQDGAVELDPSTNLLPPPPDPNFSKVNFATVTLNANDSTVTLTGLTDASSPYLGMLFFQRRRNQNAFSIQSNAGTNVTIAGTAYAKWANFKLSGGGVYNAQFLVGSMAVSGQATVTINATGKNRGKANQVFLVE